MSTMQCPHCGSDIHIQEGQPVRFCPFCGKSTQQDAGSAPSALDANLAGEKNPKKKYQMIRQALDANPEDFAANRALLFHGRLHEPLARTRARGLDFSIIKSNLLIVFDTPDACDEAALAAKYDELLRDPQLQKTMALSPDADAFFRDYLHELAYSYIHLFIRGDSKNNSLAFGFNRSQESTAKKCAEPVRRMLRNVQASDRLTDAQRMLLLGAIREGFAREFPGFDALLDMPS